MGRNGDRPTGWLARSRTGGGGPTLPDHIRELRSAAKTTRTGCRSAGGGSSTLGAGIHSLGTTTRHHRSAPVFSSDDRDLMRQSRGIITETAPVGSPSGYTANRLMRRDGMELNAQRRAQTVPPAMPRQGRFPARFGTGVGSAGKQDSTVPVQRGRWRCDRHRATTLSQGLSARAMRLLVLFRLAGDQSAGLHHDGRRQARRHGEDQHQQVSQQVSHRRMSVERRKLRRRCSPSTIPSGESVSRLSAPPPLRQDRIAPFTGNSTIVTRDTEPP